MILIIMLFKNIDHVALRFSRNRMLKLQIKHINKIWNDVLVSGTIFYAHIAYMHVYMYTGESCISLCKDRTNLTYNTFKNSIRQPMFTMSQYE